MLQVLIRKGKVNTEEVPAPSVSEGKILIRVVYSCISAGTEMANVAATGKSLVSTMLEQPEKIRKILGLIKSEGLTRLVEQYKFIKRSGQPTGYSVSGIVIGVGENAKNFAPGDAVAAAGGGYAFHAEFVEVPVNLVVKIPSGLDFKYASTVAIGAIALHGVRRASLEIGEYCTVMGTGVLGLIAVQILCRSGVRVIAADIDQDRLKLARTLGAEYCINPVSEDPVRAVENITEGKGSDAVLYAAASSDSKILSQAFQMCRRKGKMILMGVSGMEIDRRDIYSREIDLKISTSYGPGRYDKTYEEDGIDYPYSYVRWTEGRNFSEYLRLLSTRQVDIGPMIDKVFPVEQAEKAFDSLKDTKNKPVMVILDYGLPADITHVPVSSKLILNAVRSHKKNLINVGIIGVGNFAQSVHLPNLKKLNDKFFIYALASQSGVKARNVGNFYNAQYVTTSYDDIILDENIDLVMICTRHGNHASLVLKALHAGKHVFTEKPLATSLDNLNLLQDYFATHSENVPLLMVGFNRRFSPYIQEIKKHTDARIGPLFIHYRMNAGFQPADHWTHQDGGRIVGEACHIIDLVSALTNCSIVEFSGENIESHKGKFLSMDNKSILLKYEDGSLATIEYASMGSKSMAKEYMEIHFDEKSIVLDNYRQLKSFGFTMQNLTSKQSNKGHLEELIVLYDSLKGRTKKWPVDLNCLIETTKTAVKLA
ncbi:MAG: bi-domain-containing oxidoreductase [Bacteroidales bacterium]|nr:bi-domain-containing oxidoreductase [Bacteroidales bacterium]